MDQAQGQLSPELQAALQARQGGQPNAQQVPPQPAQPPVGDPAQAPVDPAQSAVPAPTPEVPFDVQEVKMIEGALINRLKAITDMQNPPVQGGQA